MTGDSPIKNPLGLTPRCDALKFDQERVHSTWQTGFHEWATLAFELERELRGVSAANDTYLQSLILAREEIRRLEKKARVFAETINQLNYFSTSIKSYADDLKELDRKL